jgi:hypothetical protein
MDQRQDALLAQLHESRRLAVAPENSRGVQLGVYLRADVSVTRSDKRIPGLDYQGNAAHVRGERCSLRARLLFAGRANLHR